MFDDGWTLWGGVWIPERVTRPGFDGDPLWDPSRQTAASDGTFSSELGRDLRADECLPDPDDTVVMPTEEADRRFRER